MRPAGISNFQKKLKLRLVKKLGGEYSAETILEL